MPHAEAIHDSGTLEQGVDALLGEAAPRATPKVRTEDPGLSAAVDQLLSQSSVPGAAAVLEAPPPAASGPPIATLDAQLAEAADDLIAGEFAGEDEILNPQPVTPAPVAVATTVVEAPEAAAPVAEPAAAEPVAKAPEPEPVARPAPRVVLPPPEPEPSAAPAVAGRSLPSPTAAASMALGALVSPLVSVLDAAATAASAPLRNRSQHVRDMVGWVAMVNLFLAVCVWVYLLAIRSPVAPDPEPLPVAVAKAAGHGEAKSEHGEGHGGDAHASAKKPAKKDKGKAKAKDAHASAEHGEH